MDSFASLLDEADQAPWMVCTSATEGETGCGGFCVAGIQRRRWKARRGSGAPGRLAGTALPAGGWRRKSIPERKDTPVLLAVVGRAAGDDASQDGFLVAFLLRNEERKDGEDARVRGIAGQCFW